MTLGTLVLRSSIRNLRRSVSTALAVALAIFIHLVMTAISQNGAQVLRDVAKSPRLIVHNAASRLLGFPRSYTARIRSIPGVEAVCAAYYIGGYYRDRRVLVPTLAMSPEDFGRMFPDYQVAPDALDRFASIKTAALVGTHMMGRFGWHVGDRITIASAFYPVPVEVTIVGIVPRVMDQAMFFRLDYFQELVTTRSGVLLFFVRAEDQAQVGKLARLIDSTFANSEAETRSELEQVFLGDLIAQFNGVLMLLRLTALMVTVAITLVAAAATANSIRERFTEIAAIRAVGFRSIQVVALLFGETMLIVTVGAMIGILGGWLIIGRAASAIVLFRITPMALGWTFGAALVIGFAAGIVPVSRALSVSIVDGLRFDQ